MKMIKRPGKLELCSYANLLRAVPSMRVHCGRTDPELDGHLGIRFAGGQARHHRDFPVRRDPCEEDSLLLVDWRTNKYSASGNHM